MTALAAEARGWRGRAACRDADPELFFIGPGKGAAKKTAAAKAVCAPCPVRGACLRDALEAQDAWALRGGTTPEERREAYPAEHQARTCRSGLHPRTPENTGRGGRCLPCDRAREAREGLRRQEERFERYGTTAPQYGKRAAA